MRMNAARAALGCLVLSACVAAAPAEDGWTTVNDAAIRLALNDREVVYTAEGNQQIGGRQSWSGDGTTRTAGGNVGQWTAQDGRYCSKRAAPGEALPEAWDCFDFAISADGKRMRFGGGAYTWVGAFVD